MTAPAPTGAVTPTPPTPAAAASTLSSELFSELSSEPSPERSPEPAAVLAVLAAVPAGAPVTPCAPAATVAFVTARFGAQLAAGLDPASRAASSRAARITELRRSGQLRDAERYGWLSLTGWLLGLPAAALGRLDPAGKAAGRRSSGRDLLPELLAADADPVPADVGGTGLLTPDPRDPLGWQVLQLAATALTAGVVDVGGRRLGGGAVTSALTARLREADRG